MTTRIYLDVDGVLNALSQSPGYGGRVESRVVKHIDRSYIITWSATLITDLAQLLRDFPEVQLIWLSTWCEEGGIKELRKACWPGLPMGTVAELIQPLRGDGSVSSWKAGIISSTQAVSPGRFVWIDDVVVDEFRHIFEHVGPRNQRPLLLSPQGARGLTPADITRMRRYLERSRELDSSI